jgi:putative DNA primase/helicase
VVLHCHTEQCDPGDIVKKLRLDWSDLRDNNKPPTKTAQPLPSERQVERWAEALKADRYWTKTRRISRAVLDRYQIGWDASARSPDGRVGAYTFPYRDAKGQLLNVKLRWQAAGNQKKTFRLFAGNATNFLWPADQLDSRWVVLVEGEPDALLAITNNIPAITSITGAGGAVRAARLYAPILKGIHVVIVADASDTGRKSAKAVAEIIVNYAEAVRVFDPFPQRDDDSDLWDWFNHHGDDAYDDFRNEIRGLPVLNKSDIDVPSRDLLFPDGTFNPPRLGMAAEDVGKLRTGPGGSLWRYEDGVYRLDKNEKWLSGYVRGALGEDFRANRLREVVSWCKANIANVPTEPSSEYVNTRNGLLYWDEKPPRLEAHSPEIPSIIQINAAWDTKARCPGVMTFLGEVLPDDCIDFMFEWIGYLLIPDSRRFQKALMLEGPRDTGKSTLLKLIGDFLGDQAVTHHTLQSICDDRFTAADLYGRLANVYADLDARNVEHSGKFKAIVGGDPINAEHKFGQTFTFSPTARMLYSANEPPGTNDQSDAYYKRWLILPMHNQLAEKEQDGSLDQRIATPEEMSGLLNAAVAGLKRLMARGMFSVPKSMKEAATRYRANTDTVVAWGMECLVMKGGVRTRQTDLYNSYRLWCDHNNRRELGLQRFKEQALRLYPRMRLGVKDGYPVFVGGLLKVRPKEPQAKVISFDVSKRARQKGAAKSP